MSRSRKYGRIKDVTFIRRETCEMAFLFTFRDRSGWSRLDQLGQEALVRADSLGVGNERERESNPEGGQEPSPGQMLRTRCAPCDSIVVRMCSSCSCQRLIAIKRL